MSLPFFCLLLAYNMHYFSSWKLRWGPKEAHRRAFKSWDYKDAQPHNFFENLRIFFTYERITGKQAIILWFLHNWTKLLNALSVFYGIFGPFLCEKLSVRKCRDMFIIVCSIKWTVTLQQGGHMTMARIMLGPW